MSATGNGDQALGGQESPVGVWAEVVGAGDPGVDDSEPHRGDAAEASGVAGGDVAGAAGGLAEEAVEQVVGGSVEEGSDIWPADEGESDPGVALEVMVDRHPLTMVGCQVILMDLIDSLLQRVYLNEQNPLRAHGGLMQLRRLLWHPGFLVPQMPQQGVAALPPAEEPEDEEEAARQTAEEPAEEREEEPEGAAPGESSDQAAGAQETTKSQHENFDDEAQGTESKDEKEKSDKKQEGA